MQHSGEVNQPAIIAIGCARPGSLARLLESINKAELPPDIQLLISLDGGASADTIRLAREFDFKRGEKDVKLHSEHLGLREHVLWVGDQTEKYGSIIVLEDDILVDRYFYDYAVSAIRAYESDTRISGIALYSPRVNEHANLPFAPLENNSSSYFMQVACSWGQAWTQSQWALFRGWYDEFAKTGVPMEVDMPQAVKAWPESSWKKYFAAYLVHQDKYFNYPYRSYTTNCSDAGGTHVAEGNSVFQVPFADQSRQLERLEHDSFSAGAIIYDSYMEPSPWRLGESLGVSPDDLEVDIYGCKPKDVLRKKKFALTTKRCSEYIRATRLTLKPVEQNIYLAEHQASAAAKWSDFSPIAYLAESQYVVENKAKFIRLFLYYAYQRPIFMQFGLQYLRMFTIRTVNRLRRLILGSR